MQNQIKKLVDLLLDSMIKARQRQADAYLQGMVYHDR